MNYLLIGQPNVGKTSIYNILTGSNINIVHSEAGTTRDWHKELIIDSSSYVFDTPGILIKNKKLSKENNFLLKNNINDSINLFIYVVDYKIGFNDVDHASILELRKHNKKIILVVNKSDNLNYLPHSEYFKYGIADILYVSCAHRLGIDKLKSIIESENSIKLQTVKNDFSIAIFGKPNAGKSTYLNSLLGFSRSLTSPIAGTTSDNVVDNFFYKEKNFKVIDTAGIGKKSNVKNKSVNYFSIKKSIESIFRVDSAIIIIDSSEGLDRQDKRIINLVTNKSKSIVLIFNKFDLIENKNLFKLNMIKEIDQTLSQVKNIKVFFISALLKKDIFRILDYQYDSIFENEYLISTGKINRWLKDTTNNNQHPLIENKKVNFKYALQVKSKPVTIKIFCNYSDRLRDSYKRFLINNFNNKFKILNQKTKFIFSSSINPYV
jgi:GTP-binding protein